MAWTVLDALNITDVDLVGNDSGGAIAKIMIAKAPERVSSLILTNCDVHDNWPPDTLKAIRASAPNGLAEGFAAIVVNPDLIRTKGGLAGMVFSDPEIVTDEFVDIFLRPLTQMPEKREAFNRYVAPQDPTQLTRIEMQLRAFDGPVLILWGTDDIFFATKWAYWLKNTFPNARSVIEFDGAKLFFPFEQPDAVNAEIFSFWRDM